MLRIQREIIHDPTVQELTLMYRDKPQAGGWTGEENGYRRAGTSLRLVLWETKQLWG